MKKTFLPTLFALVLCLVLLSVSAFAADAIEYYSGADGAKDTATSYMVLTSENDGSVTSGIYYVSGEVSVGALTFNGDTTLVLGSGATLTVNGTLHCGGTLTVTTVTGAAGAKLVAKGSDATSDSSYGIYATGSVNIYVGEVTATGGAASSASTSYSYSVYAPGGVTVANNAKLTATGSNMSNASFGMSYGIYASSQSDDSITVSDTATVEATGGTVTATGGTSTASSSESYGIRAYNQSGKGMTVSGTATVTATGGTASGTSYGIYAEGDSVDGMAVSGGTVTLTVGSTIKGALKTDADGKTLLDYLADGTAYQKDGSVVDGKVKELSDVKVVEHTHSYDSIGKCACGQKAVWYQAYNTGTGKFETKPCGAYTVIDSNTDSYSGGWLVVEKDTTISGTLVFSGAVNLILCDGATLTVNNGLSTNGNLTIYGGEKGTGKLAVTTSSSVSGVNSFVAIQTDGCDLTVHGGNITATATADNASSSCGISIFSFTVYGGSVSGTGGKATGSIFGSSSGIAANNITVIGGTVNATGGKASNESVGIYTGNITVNSGTVKATGGAANGSCGIYASNITVNSGTVTATSGTATDSYGIFADKITVSGGTLKLTEGSYVSGTLTVSNPVTLAVLLADGCAYQLDGNDAPSKLADLTSPLSSVKIVTHEHDYESGKCVYCGKAKPSSGSSSSTTVKNEDGSTTTTTTDKKTGEVTETTKDVNGVTGTTVTDKNGNVTDVSANIPASATKDGETVTLPIEKVKPENGTEIKIDVPKGGATIEIPVENPTPDTVIVIVDENGNETVVPDTKLTENGVTVTLSESATIKVIRNGKTFSDVKKSDYFCDAVLWASARNITGGIGNDLFGPHDSCTRAQLVTFLWRAAGCPAAEYEMNFSDVGDGYYTEAVRWAASLGIVGGYGNGLFGSDDTITREQMAVILYRFAQHTGMDTTHGGMSVREYKDYESVSDYAVTAIQWAVNAGVMQGYDGNLMPGQPCTRAQIVTMLYRLLGTN